MALLQMLSVASTFGLYLAFVITYIRYFHFCYLLFRGFPKRALGKRRPLIHRVGLTRLGPVYRESYFGYDGFGVQIDEKIVILHPDHYLRVYGIVRPWSRCLLLYKYDTVKTIIVLDERLYGDKVMTFFENTYKWILIIIYGGVVLWQICSMFLTSHLVG